MISQSVQIPEDHVHLCEFMYLSLYVEKLGQLLGEWDMKEDRPDSRTDNGFPNRFENEYSTVFYQSMTNI